jgi:antitoxin HicB
MEVVEDDGVWVASIPDLPGCNSFGDTVTEAVENVQRTKDLWLEGQYKVSADIPEPTDEGDFSGKFVLRIPRVLHRSLAYEATKQGVSLNHYATYLLAQRQPLNALQNFAQSLFDTCPNWKTPWLYSQHEHGKTVMVGRLSADTDFLMVMRIPPAQGKYKTSIHDSARKQYCLTK